MSHLKSVESSFCLSLDKIKVENLLIDIEDVDEVAPMYVDISQVKTECEDKDLDFDVKPIIDVPNSEATIPLKGNQIKQEKTDFDDDLLEITGEYYLDSNGDSINHSQNPLESSVASSVQEYSIDIEEHSLNYSDNNEDCFSEVICQEISLQEPKNGTNLTETENSLSSNTDSYSGLLCHKNTNKADKLEKNVPDNVQLSEQKSTAFLIEVPKTNWMTIDMDNNPHEDVSPDDTDLTIEYNPLEYQHVPQLTTGTSYGLTQEVIDPTKKLLQCPRCPYETTDATHLQIHKKTHRFIFSCSECSYFAGTLNKVELHEVKKHGKIKELPHCKYCAFTTKTHKELRKHTSKEHGKLSHRKSTLECPECDYKTSNKGNLLKHNIRQHQKGIKCPVCPRYFEDNANYQKHMSSHIYMEVDNSAFKCTRCKLEAKTTDYLVEHYKNTHEEKSKHACYDCNYVFTYPSKLLKHTKYVHKKNLQEL